MFRTLVLALAIAACGGKTGVYSHDYSGSLTLTLVNQSPRPVQAVFIYPLGSTNRGTSWTSIAPGATTKVSIREGNFELVAVSAKRRIDAKYSETPEAMTSLELRANQTLVFHDANQTPTGVGAPNTLAVTFMLGQAEPTPAPAPEGTTEQGTEPGAPTPPAP
jgi:hypothetical protein